MTARIHRGLVALGNLLAGIAVLPTAFDTSVLGIEPQVWAIFGLGSLVVPLVATFVREAFEPS